MARISTGYKTRRREEEDVGKVRLKKETRINWHLPSSNIVNV